MEEKEKCFAYHDNVLGWKCAVLNVKDCEYPNCKTYKTHEQIVAQKKKCKARIESYPKRYQDYLREKYGEYDTEEK